MAANLTVDNLCEALKHFLTEIAKHPEAPVDRENGLTLWGLPADEEMRAVMEAFGGTLQITIRELPLQLVAVELEKVGNLWHPNTEEK